MNEYIEKWDRALRFLVEKGHHIGTTDGHTIIVDGTSCRIADLPDLAGKRHHDDWVASETAFFEGLLGPPR